jgi:hypothetical protein
MPTPHPHPGSGSGSGITDLLGSGLCDVGGLSGSGGVLPE